VCAEGEVSDGVGDVEVEQKNINKKIRTSAAPGAVSFVRHPMGRPCPGISFYLPTPLSVYLPPSLSLSLSLSLYLSLYLSIHLSIYLSLSLYIYTLVYVYMISVCVESSPLTQSQLNKTGVFDTLSRPDAY